MSCKSPRCKRATYKLSTILQTLLIMNNTRTHTMAHTRAQDVMLYQCLPTHSNKELKNARKHQL